METIVCYWMSSESTLYEGNSDRFAVGESLSDLDELNVLCGDVPRVAGPYASVEMCEEVVDAVMRKNPFWSCVVTGQAASRKSVPNAAMMIWSVDDDGRFTTLKRIPLKPALKPTDLVVVHADLRDMAAMADELVTKLPELGLNVRLVNELITDQIVVAISPKPIVYGDVRKVLNLEPEPLDEAIDAIAAMMKLMSPHEGLEIDRSAPELTESVERLLEAGVKFSEDVVRVICWPHPENEPQSEILRELETHADYEKLDGFLESYYRGMSI